MSGYDIRIIGDPVLRQTAREITDIDSSLVRLVDDMLETMYDAPGVGLAANQIGIARRFVVVDASKDRDAEGDDEAPRCNPICLINPEIVRLGDRMRTYEEGCLSLPDVLVEVERPSEITVRYVDRDGNPRELEADGLLATVIQHEVDHLDGKLIIDYLSSLKRNMIVRRFKKLARQA